MSALSIDYKFESEAMAKLFVERVMLYVQDVAMLRDGVKVRVVMAKEKQSEVDRMGKVSGVMVKSRVFDQD